jgi:hypothetical protein
MSVIDQKVVLIQDLDDKIRTAVLQQNKAEWNKTFTDCERKLGFTGISHWVNKRRNFDLCKMMQIAKFFNVQIKIEVKIIQKEPFRENLQKEEFMVILDERYR